MDSDPYDDATFVDEGGSSLEVHDRIYGVDDIRPLMFAPAGDVSGPVVPIVANATESTGAGCRVDDYGESPQTQSCSSPQETACAATRSSPRSRPEQPHSSRSPRPAPPGVVLRPTLLDPRGLTIPAASISQEATKALVAAAVPAPWPHGS